jgi:pimeloyl-ACP methyl ester carboxylesterase
LVTVAPAGVARICLVPQIERPDGVEIHWEAHGEGPNVLLTHHTLWSYPLVYERLIADLARDHRVVLYDPRGCGESSRRGPYDFETDAGDVQGVIEEAGPAAVAIAVGDGVNRVARVAVARPDLISQVLAIMPGVAAMLPRQELKGSDVMLASDSVIEMLLTMMNTDPRAALRTLIASINPDLDEQDVRDRIERVSDYLSFDAATGRAHAFLDDDLSRLVNALGDRVWILHGGPDPLFEGSLHARVAQLFPRAHLETMANGPISRPDLTAARVRAVTRSTS